MEFLESVLKALGIAAMLLLMAAPLIYEFYSFRRDKNKKISYKRFRIVAYSVVYVLAVTLTLYLLKETLISMQKTSFITWLINKIALSTRKVYCGKVLVAVLVNFCIGLVYCILGRFVRIGLKKKNLVTPKKNGEFSWQQKLERKLITFFHTETWYFVASILKWFNVILSLAYAVIFTLYIIPALYGVNLNIYNVFSLIFDASYHYPVITLLLLWEVYFFLEGIKRLEDECPELISQPVSQAKAISVDIEAIDKEVSKQFKDYYAVDVALSDAVREELSSQEHHPITKFICRAVENDKRNPQTGKEVYLNCLDKLVSTEKSVLINGNFFSEFSMYFLRYLSAVIARSDNVVFVCNNDTQINTVYEYITDGLSQISSFYCKGFGSDSVDFDSPIWRVIKISGEHSVIEEAAVDENNILVTSLSYLCSARFEAEHSRFITLIDTVVFVDTLNTVNMFNRQLAILNTRLKHITRNNSLSAKNGKVSEMFRVRYMSRQIRYICFDDTRTPGLDKILKNMLSVDMDSVDAMNYSTSTIVRCYNFEGKPDENGRRICPQFFKSEEEIGAVMNMAVLCLAKGASSVSVFADDVIPYGNIAETIASNMGQLAIKADGNNLRINKRYYNPDNYSVMIAIDSSDNLPATLRRYVSMASDKPMLIIVFSRPYMLRDYYLSNIETLWNSTQLERVPVEEGTKRDIAQKILVKANAGGITRAEILRLIAGVPQFDEYLKNEDVNGVLRCVLEVYGIQHEDRLDLFRYFEYTASHDFDETGKYNPEDKVVLRRRGELFEMLNGRNMVTMVTGEGEIILPMPKSRLTQNYIAGQNLMHNGNVYYIQKIDSAAGRLYARLAVGGKNDEAYRYVQARRYRLTLENDKLEYVFPTKHVVLNRNDENVAVNDVYVSVFRAPAEVITSGYYEIDPHTLAVNSVRDEYHSISDEDNDTLAKQTYRRYGEVEEPFYSSDSVMKVTHLNAGKKGAQVMCVRICGSFGEAKDKVANLAAVMLNEVISSMFPSVKDSVSVCPVTSEASYSEEGKKIIDKQPGLTIVGDNSLNSDLTLFIIEDCATDLGVVSGLMSAGDDILNTLFAPVFNYLRWYFSAEEKSKYLYFDGEEEPDCFDFEGLYKLSGLLGDDGHDLKYVNIESVIEYESCDFCGKRYARGEKIIQLDDGRKMCNDCAQSIVGNNKKILKAHLDRAKIYLESTYGIVLDDDYDFCFESTLKIINTLKQNQELQRRGTDVPLKAYVDDKRKVHVEYDVPSVNLSEILVRELTYVWQLKHLPELDEGLAEGHIGLVAIQYLRFLNENTLAKIRTSYYESTNSSAGEGYRKLVHGLLENPGYNNNPFRYLLEMAGITDTEEAIHQPAFTDTADLGLNYTAQPLDRNLQGEVEYFYYSRLTASQQAAYDALLNGIINYQPTVTVNAAFDDVNIASAAIKYDRPGLFWYNNFSMTGDQVTFMYGASMEEAQLLETRIEEAIKPYLADIDDSMSAYDVAIRIHTRLIAAVDYDTIALNKQTEEGGPKDDKIDYLRTICGVFLQSKAVCEGYARAMQYLLQKCGIECAEAVGFIHKENGENDEAHAWNIVKIDGDYYYIDTTWDDSSNTVQTVKKTDTGFNYFLITTEELSRTRDTSLCPVTMPNCTATKANYYFHNGLAVNEYSVEAFKKLALDAVKRGSKAFTFKCTAKAVFDKAMERICADGADCFEILKAASKADKQIVPTSYSYTYDKNIRTVTVIFKYK